MIAIASRLVCPRCSGPLEHQPAGLLCPSCALLYPVREGIAVMLEEEAESLEPGSHHGDAE